MAKIKKSLSSLDHAALVQELQCLIGGHIRKAYQPTRVAEAATSTSRSAKILGKAKVVL